MTSAVQPPERPVIAGIDRGPGHEDLVRFAAREAALHGRPLQIAHAFELPLPGGSVSDEEESRSAAKASAQLVEHYERLAREEVPGLSVSGELIMGPAAAGLIERSADAELIVIGHRGSGGFPRLPLGSVSWQVATHAECPVVVVRPSETAERPDNRVVVGVDTDDASLQALDVAFLEAGLRGARLDMVHCASDTATSPTGAVTTVPVDPTWVRSGQREFFDTELGRRRDRHPGVEVNLRIEHASPGQLLVEASTGACNTTASVLSRHTGYDADITRAILQACATACEACADECSAHADQHEHCRLCAEACRSCEKACNELIQALG